MSNRFKESLPPVVSTSERVLEAVSGEQGLPGKKKGDFSRLVATAESAKTPEMQLWRVQRLYDSGLKTFEGQMTYQKMLETLKEEELQVARKAGVTGTDGEIIAARLSLVSDANILRVLDFGQVPKKTKLTSFGESLVGLTAAFTIAAAFMTGLYYAGNYAEKPEEPSTRQPAAPFVILAVPPASSAAVPEPEAPLSGRVRFEYTTNNGVYPVGSGEKSFGIKFAKADRTSIYVLNDDPSIDKVARVEDARAGQRIDFADYDSALRYYIIRTGETFLMKNKEGYYMQVRVDHIKDSARGDTQDEIVFEYQINDDKSGTFKALPAPTTQDAAATRTPAAPSTKQGGQPRPG